MNDKAPTPLNKEIETGNVLLPSFNADGLLTAVVQDSKSGEVLMVAHMNELALKKTIETGQSNFWSRSRQELWHKGATSGDFQFVEEIRIDCDQDAIVLKVRLAADAVCHTGARSCFYRKIELGDQHPYLVHDEAGTNE